MSHKRFYAKAGFIWLSQIYRKKSLGFLYKQQYFLYFHHRYNVTWLNERCVEIPIMMSILQAHPGVRLLEVGNVLSHYTLELTHPVVDLYEKAVRQNLYTQDAETFQGGPYDLIVSISTFEHVGWDEFPRDEDKIYRTIRHLRGLLAPGGELVFSVPVGYSPPLDRVLDDASGFIDRGCLQRVNARNEWREVAWDDIKAAQFHKPYPFANGLVVGRMGAI
jgi:SAM-dependent methyltransferase